MATGETPVLRVPPDEYGPNYRDHLLDQYKLYVQMADHISERRTSANNFLLTVNSGLITLYGLSSSTLSSTQNRSWQYLVPMAGILVCLAWLALIRSYRQINAVKFEVIHEIEQHLPVAGLAREWNLAQRGQGRTYVPLTHIEPYIPWVFVGLYVLLVLISLWKK